MGKDRKTHIRNSGFVVIPIIQKNHGANRDFFIIIQGKFSGQKRDKSSENLLEISHVLCYNKLCIQRNQGLLEGT